MFSDLTFHNTSSKYTTNRLVRKSVIIQFKWPYFIYIVYLIIWRRYTYCEFVIQFDINARKQRSRTLDSYIDRPFYIFNLSTGCQFFKPDYFIVTNGDRISEFTCRAT